ncbi:MAG TPA: enoyl-CoA hydratase/isomerase family protein [Dongiaceae bacterium]|jgi:enoyl-CoA hydratase/carnithine racemase
MSTVIVERRGAVAIVTLNRPDRLNAIGGGLLQDLHLALAEAEADESVGVILLAGAGRAFCAGDDLKEFDQQTETNEAIEKHITGIQQITKDLMFSHKLVVGAAQGFAVGGGFEWMLNCDLTVAADDLVAFFPEMEWGQFVTGGVTHLLPLAVGYQRAMELIVLGERQSAARLQELGLVNWVVPREQMLPRALEVAEKVAKKSRFSVGRLKRVINSELSSALKNALNLEEGTTIQTFQRPEAKERIKAFTERKK